MLCARPDGDLCGVYQHTRGWLQPLEPSRSADELPLLWFCGEGHTLADPFPPCVAQGSRSGVCT